MIKEIHDNLNPAHDGYIYDPETGRLFHLQEIIVTEICYDDKVRSTRRKIKNTRKPCTHIIMFLMTGIWPKEGMFIDHKNGNALDNSWSNLREATPRQNVYNRAASGKWGNNTEGCGDCVYPTPGGKYRVRIGKINIGVYDNVEEANQIALDTRRRLYGEFHREEQ